jgi:hypothetical protein
MANFVKITPSVSVSAGGINYRGALIQADYYRIFPATSNHKPGLQLQAIHNDKCVFQTFLLMTKKQSILLSELARETISNCHNPLLDHDK